MSKKRAIAFLDILGFKDLLHKNELSVIVSKYMQAIKMAEVFNSGVIYGNAEPSLLETKDELGGQLQTLKNLEKPFLSTFSAGPGGSLRVMKQALSQEPSLFATKPNPEGWCIKRVFSDSIILVAREDTEESCLRLLIFIWRLMQAFFSIKLPFRGGIAYDEIFVDEKNEIFMGRGLTKAYELEGCQQWIGVAIDSDLQKTYPNIFSDINRPYLENIFLKYSVPFKGGATRSLHTINWRFNFIVEEGTRSIMPYSLDKNVIEKVENTLIYAKSVIDSKNIYISNESNAPIEVRSFWCGSKQPPFPHGDDL